VIPAIRVTSFWEARLDRMLDLVTFPCTPAELTRALKDDGWLTAIVTNTIAYAEGRKIFFAHGKWHRPRYYHGRDSVERAPDPPREGPPEDP
jgi:hypothetical protein